MKRSWLFVPGNRAHMIEKAQASDADLLILDLEDSVSLEQKPAAREITRTALQDTQRPIPLWVRINALESNLIADDLEAILAANPDGIVLPKAQGGNCVKALITAANTKKLPCPPVLAIATESAAAIFGLGSYGGLQAQLAGLSWGAEDLSADLASATTRESSGALTGPYALARNLMLIGAKAAKVQAVDTVWTDLQNQEGLKAECITARRDGFAGKLAIHPAQVPIINQCFTPSEAEIKEAQDIVAAFAAAPGTGAIALNGKMIDMPHLKRARLLLAQFASSAT